MKQAKGPTGTTRDPAKQARARRKLVAARSHSRANSESQRAARAFSVQQQRLRERPLRRAVALAPLAERQVPHPRHRPHSLRRVVVSAVGGEAEIQLHFEAGEARVARGRALQLIGRTLRADDKDGGRVRKDYSLRRWVFPRRWACCCASFARQESRDDEGLVLCPLSNVLACGMNPATKALSVSSEFSEVLVQRQSQSAVKETRNAHR